MPSRRLTIVKYLVSNSYLSSSDDFAKWMWENHVPIVALFCQRLINRFGGNEDVALSGAWLHDFGDAFINRFDPKHEIVSKQEALKVLQKAGFTDKESGIILNDVIAPHSCHPGNLPTIHEGKILATADALAHIKSDFYIQLCWKHIPQDKTYQEFRKWVATKIKRDFNEKIFFHEIRDEVRETYSALVKVFAERL